jgi:hypothetical protein
MHPDARQKKTAAANKLKQKAKLPANSRVKARTHKPHSSSKNTYLNRKHIPGSQHHS